LGYTDFKDGPAKVASFYEWTLNGAYNFGFLKFGALFESFQNTTSGTSFDAIHYLKTSAKFPIGKDEIIFNLGRNNLGNNSTLSNNGHGYQYQIGYAHNFSSRTRLYTFLQTFNADDSISSNALHTFGIGLSHNF